MALFGNGRIIFSSLVLGWWLLLLCQTAWAVTDEQRTKLTGLSERISTAGRLFAEEKYSQSAAEISAVQQELLELLKSRDPALQRLVKPIYARLLKAHGLLELEGATLPPIPNWEELTNTPLESKAGTGSPPPVSFKTEIAPWLIGTCGQCHINQQRGQFSMSTYAAIMQGTRGAAVLFAGSSRGSRLVEVIESGDMPRGGGQVTAEQLATLKRWIDEGAKFDGPNPTAPLATYAASAAVPGATPASNLQPKMSTGSETMSFAKTIAPILLANCQGCHLDSQQASGGLRMDTFTQFLRGGDSGAVIVPNKPTESLLVKKIRGEEGDRMPAGGRPPLKPDEILAIETWIREGATFDGPSPEMATRVVVDQVWAASANHRELMERRKQRSLERWTKVIPNDQPATAASEELFVLGNVPQSRIDTILQHYTQATLQAKKLLKAPAGQPLLRGGLTVFVLKNRYDYSEFGRMTERRELPKEWFGHWYADPLDAYGVLAADAIPSDPKPADKQAEALAMQIVVGAYLGSCSQVPAWFSEGVARNLVKQSFRRGDERVLAWQQNYPTALQKVDKAETLLAGQLDEESAGLVGMGLTSFLMERSNRRRFDQLLQLLREGEKFDSACAATFAPPEAMVKAWLGKK